jgi:hypothetical protein
VARGDGVALGLDDVAVGRPPQRRRRAAEVRERAERTRDLRLELVLGADRTAAQRAALRWVVVAFGTAVAVVLLVT